MDALFLVLLTWCGVSDLRKRIIANALIVVLFCLGFAHFGYMLICRGTWWQYPSGLLLAIPFFIAWLRNGMGAGDVKLIAAIALYMGLINTIAAFALMIPILAALLLRSWFTHRPKTNRIPLAPVIGFGAAGTVVLGYILRLVNH